MVTPTLPPKPRLDLPLRTRHPASYSEQMENRGLGVVGSRAEAHGPLHSLVPKYYCSRFCRSKMQKIKTVQDWQRSGGTLCLTPSPQSEHRYTGGTDLRTSPFAHSLPTQSSFINLFLIRSVSTGHRVCARHWVYRGKWSRGERHPWCNKYQSRPEHPGRVGRGTTAALQRSPSSWGDYAWTSQVKENAKAMHPRFAEERSAAWLR